MPATVSSAEKQHTSQHAKKQLTGGGRSIVTPSIQHSQASKHPPKISTIILVSHLPYPFLRTRKDRKILYIKITLFYQRNYHLSNKEGFFASSS
jgi:hypothetical protein